MKKNIVEKIVSYVENTSDISISEFLKKDNDNFELTIFCLGIVNSKKDIILYKDGKKIIFYSAQDIIMEAAIDGEKYLCQGTSVKPLYELLIAIRIHEVESYEIFNYPPDMREQRLKSIYSYYGISGQNIDKLTQLWMNTK
ncbi:hypothetical protein [Aeromonas molluscorum]|uniref:hypothetical protein n=1 Tax=Aeromonas molluscorum TaxID=271417 RepID=UPI003F1A4E03